jgi:hypothetical protein
MVFLKHRIGLKDVLEETPAIDQAASAAISQPQAGSLHFADGTSGYKFRTVFGQL